MSPYFSDPEGDVLSFSATTSDAAVVGVAVSGDVVTITHTGAGNAVVNTVARDPGGLATQQGIPVSAVSDQPTPDPEPPERAPLESPQLAPAQPGPPAVEQAGSPGQEDARVQHPIFPQRLLTGFVEPTGNTLQRGRSWASAGYMGASPLAQVGDIDEVVPGIAQMAYGVTDDLTVTAGAGYIYYNVGAGDSDLFPYVVPKFRVYADERVSVAVAGYASLFLAEETLTYYGGSAALSVAAAGGFRLHAAGGMLGVSGTTLGETHTDQAGVAALGGDFLVTPQLRLAGEYRRVAFEDGTSIVTAGLGFIRAAIISEFGFAYYLEDEAEIRPIVSVAYRF